MEPARKLTLDNLDVGHVEKDPEVWEKVVRKLRAGMMPPSGLPRPKAANYEAMISWLETELDRHAVTHLPPPGLHRLNRTEYGNVIRDLLALDVDPAKFLPSDDSTRGFDNIAGDVVSLARAARRLRYRRREDQPPGDRRCDRALALHLSRALRTLRRTITSKVCRSGRVAAWWRSMSSLRTAITSSRSSPSTKG